MIFIIIIMGMRGGASPPSLSGDDEGENGDDEGGMQMVRGRLEMVEGPGRAGTKYQGEEDEEREQSRHDQRGYEKRRCSSQECCEM